MENSDSNYGWKTYSTIEIKHGKTRIEDMWSCWFFKQQRALLWHACKLCLREATVYSQWRTTDTASQPTPVLSRLVASCSVALHKYMHVDIHSCSITLRVVQHLRTLIYTHAHGRMYTDEAGTENEMKMKW